MSQLKYAMEIDSKICKSQNNEMKFAKYNFVFENVIRNKITMLWYIPYVSNINVIIKYKKEGKIGSDMEVM